MSFLERTTTFLVERVAPKLIFGQLRDEAALAELERQAHAEIEARIRRGRPGPEEWRPRPSRARGPAGSRSDGAPAPRPAVQVRPTRPVAVHRVTLGAIEPAVEYPRAVEVPLSERPA
jgi:hypothetical protein